MSEYISNPMYALDVPIDLRAVFQEEKPAGRHGFLQVAGDHFAFADGTPARFWGTNFNGGSCFPEHDYAEKMARRLAKIGINLVRFHQLDAEWNTPNIFQFTKGAWLENTQSLDPESMDRLDYFVYCLKREGIYLYMDLLTYRRFRTGDGVAAARDLPDAAKPYCLYNRRMIELQKQYAYDIFHHINPYTGLAYKDEPALVMTEIVNECDLFSKPIKIEPYVTELRTLFRQWLDENGIEFDAENCDLAGVEDPIIQFKMAVHDRYYAEMYDFLRKIGVQYPITGTNWTKNTALLKSNLKMDYTDSHTYFYDWNWKERTKSCINTAMTQLPESGLAVLAFMRTLDKPFFVSEWDVPWPNEYRAECAIIYPAVGALQGWSGFAIHTYAYSPDLRNMKILGKEVSSDAIGGVPYREGIFSAWNDPAKFGLFYHSALITRRGDVSPANRKIAVKVEDLKVRADHRIAYQNNISALALDNSPLKENVKPALNVATELSRVGIAFDDPADADQVVSEKHPIVDLDRGEVLSDNGQLYRNWEKNYGYVDTGMTKCVYGFLGKNEPVELDGLTVDGKTDFAVIALSSLTKEPIASSQNMLLTAVGRARNTNAVFDGEKMLDWGEPPIQIEVIHADIAIRTDKPNLKVWTVNPEGFYTGAVPSVYEDGVLKFTIGEKWRGMHYLIQGE